MPPIITKLTELAATKDGVRNYNIAVREWGEKIIFLRKIMEGGTNRSYGIQVAKLAGVPAAVIARAKEILRNLEKGELDAAGMPKLARGMRTDGIKPNQLSLFSDEPNPILEEIRTLDPTRITPMEALQPLGMESQTGSGMDADHGTDGSQYGYEMSCGGL